MKQWLLHSLGGSDIQYPSNSISNISQRRMKDYAKECQGIFELISETLDHTIIITPMISGLINELRERSRQVDHLVLIYTNQPVPQERDTYWAYRIIKLLAEDTDYFGYQFEVTGVHVQGNPARLEDMLSLYYHICTPESLISWGVQDEDRLAACFTAGTPAMKQALMMAFSALHYPKERACYEVEASANSDRSSIYLLPVVELLRHEDLLQIVQERLSSKRFDEARLLLINSSFQFLQSKSAELELVITMLHKRFLFDFKGALKCYELLPKNSPLRDRFAQEKKHLQICAEAFARIRSHRYDTLRNEKCMKVLIYEYFHKLRFFYRAKMWNEFTFLASSFYEWLLQICFYHVIGSDIVRTKEQSYKKKDWGNYLMELFRTQPNRLDQYSSELKLIFQNQINYSDYKNSNRKFYEEVLKHDPWGAQLVKSEWNTKMNSLYTKIRNHITHTLTSIEEDEIIRILSKGNTTYTKDQWLKDTVQLLETLFQDKVEQAHLIDHSIESLIDYMKSLFQHTYVPPLKETSEIRS